MKRKFRIKELMLEKSDKEGKKIRQKDIAEATGIRQNVLSQIANGVIQNPKLDHLEAIADFFSVTIDELIGRNPPVRDAIRHGYLPWTDPTLLMNQSVEEQLSQIADPVKEVAQLASVLNFEFTEELLAAISSLDLDKVTLGQALQQLTEADLLHRQKNVSAGETTYTFKTPRVQAEIYRLLLPAKRRVLHQQIAQGLEKQFPNMSKDQPELLAHHYTEAALTEQGILYWQKAGQQAKQSWDNKEAIRHFKKAIELVQTLPDSANRAQQELELRLDTGSPMMEIEGYTSPKVEDLYNRAYDLWEKTSVASEIEEDIFSAIRGLWVNRLVGGNLQKAQNWALQLLTIAQKADTPDYFLEAHMAMGGTLCRIGELEEAREHLEKGIVFSKSKLSYDHILRHGHDPEILCISDLAHTLWFLGYLKQAKDQNQKALDLAHKQAHPLSLAFVLFHSVAFYFESRDLDPIRDLISELASLLRNHQLSHWERRLPLFRGRLLIKLGKNEEGIKEINEGVSNSREAGSVGFPMSLALQAEAYGEIGAPQQGLRAIDEALNVIAEKHGYWYAAELYRIKGDLLLSIRPENHRQATRFYHQAIEIARHQKAKLFELRTATRLVSQKKVETQEARQMLQSIYEWFGEGFDTKDLTDAKALLEGLK